MLGELDSYMWRNEIRSFFNTIHKNKLKMDQRPKCKAGHYKTLRGKHRQHSLNINPSNNFLDPPPREHISQHNKSHLWQTHSQYNTQQWKAKSLPAKISNKTRMPTLTISIQRSIGSPSHSNQTRKRNKTYPNWKGSKTVTVCRWNDIIHRKS